MPISIGNQGSGAPYIRFSPQANAWMRGTADGPEEFDPKGSPIAMDVERIVLGWLTLGEGVREWAAWPNINQRTPQPSPEAKSGFICKVFAPKLLGEDVHEFSANSTASVRFIEEVYNKAEANFGQGKVPLVQITGSKAIKVGKGTTREIHFEITKWIDRPAVLDGGEAEPAKPVEQPKAAEKPKAAAKPELADAEF